MDVISFIQQLECLMWSLNIGMKNNIPVQVPEVSDLQLLYAKAVSEIIHRNIVSMCSNEKTPQSYWLNYGKKSFE